MDNVCISGCGVDVSYASGRGNPEHRGRHLYVLQDATGQIKIGRSKDPARRGSDLQNATGRQITVVLILNDRGNDEQIILSAVAQYREYGEWFRNCAMCKRKIEQALRVSIPWISSKKIAKPSQRSIVEDAVARLCDKIKAKAKMARSRK